MSARSLSPSELRAARIAAAHECLSCARAGNEDGATRAFTLYRALYDCGAGGDASELLANWGVVSALAAVGRTIADDGIAAGRELAAAVMEDPAVRLSPAQRQLFARALLPAEGFA